MQLFYEDARRQRHRDPAAGRQRSRTTASSRWTARRIRYGLGAIKGTGESAHRRRSSRRARRAARSRDLFDFCRRVDKRIVNRRVIEALVRAGAFDAVDDHRARAAGLGGRGDGGGRAGAAQRHPGRACSTCPAAAPAAPALRRSAALGRARAAARTRSRRSASSSRATPTTPKCATNCAAFVRTPPGRTWSRARGPLHARRRGRSACAPR
ncbi:MAG: hypothetical protein MZW92_60690 [Comamonadaceae bacterium]|nr:hypothetical protein [Comamonadaceae bacterium]